MNFTPIGARVLVRPIEEPTTLPSGIVLPQQAVDKPQRGEVLAAGEGDVADNGSLTPMQVAVGDQVVYSKYGQTEVEVDGEDLLLIHQRDILGKVS